MKQVSIALAWLATVAVAGGAGYWFGSTRTQASGQPFAGHGNSAAPKDADEAIERFANAAIRWKGPFVDPLDQLDARQKLDAVKQEVVAFGPPAFDSAVRFLGDPSKWNVSDGPTGVNIKNGTRDPIVREAIVELMPQLDRERAPKELASRLLSEYESERVRAHCAGELAHLDKNVAIPALVEALDRASEHAWNGSRAIVEALAATGGRDAEEALLRAFQRPTTTPELRNAATAGLGLLKCKDAVPALENTIRHENRDHYLRREAVRALLRIDPARAAEIVADQIPRENDGAFKTFLEDVARTNPIK
jgi:HEAT repeat protein